MAVDDRRDAPYPTRRISLGLSDGGEMHVSIPGKPEEPVDERTLEALRSIGEAALAKLKGDEPEQQSITWADVRAGDEISLLVLGHFGFERERRSVVAVDWPKITLAEGGRCYEIDASEPDKVNRAIERRRS